MVVNDLGGKTSFVRAHCKNRREKLIQLGFGRKKTNFVRGHCKNQNYNTSEKGFLGSIGQYWGTFS